MIDVGTVYSIIANLLRKNQQGYLTPAEFTRYANIANKSRFNDLYGSPERMRNGIPTREAYDQAQQIDEKLSVFIVPGSLVVNPTTGQVSRPSDLLRMDSVYVSSGPVRRVSKDKEANWVRSKIMPPTIDYPIYVDYGTYYQFHPFNVGTVPISYLSQPTDVLWAYTVDGNGRPIYDASSSVHFKWEDSEIGNIVSKILEYAGKSVGDNAAVQLGAQLETKGQ